MKFFSAMILAALLSGCGAMPGSRPTKMYPAGEKATFGKLIYSVVDTQMLASLGDDPESHRVPKNRFFLVEVAVSNGGSTDLPIPAMSLVDEAGNKYAELSDGAGVPQWLGMVRRVSPGQTERGHVVFDAPATHMKLRLTDDSDESDILVDVPLSYAHEQTTREGAPLGGNGEIFIAPGQKQ